MLWLREKLVEYCIEAEEAFVEFAVKFCHQVIVHKVTANAQMSLINKVKYFLT